MSVNHIKAAAKRLAGTGGGEALETVLHCCSMLEREKGRLDYQNLIDACRALIESITPLHRQSEVMLDLAELLETDARNP